MGINQILLTLFGCLAIYFVSRNDKLKKYGYVFGLLSQPFWFIETYINEQWGIFILCLWYTYCWIQGIYNYWFKKEGK